MAKKKNQAAHAKLSASGSERWISCPGSIKLEEAFPSRETDYTLEGTLAHELAELKLNNEFGNIDHEQYEANRAKLLSDPKFKKFYSTDMDEEVDKYVAFIIETYTEMVTTTPDAQIYFERKYDLSPYTGDEDNDGFGTVDNSLVGDKTLRITDLKYGKGVKVFAEENSQLKLYALGVLDAFDMMYDIDTCILTIVQPRLDHIDEWKVSVTELRAWAEDIVKPAAKEALSGSNIFLAGGHCKFCRARNVCKALADKNLEIAKFEFEEPETLSDIQIAEILSMAPLYIAWINSIKDYTEDQALNHGKKWPGFKVVAGRSNRVWLSEADVVETLKLEGLEDDQIFKKALRGITDIEKILGKKTFSVIMEGLVAKPEGKPTLVPEEDKRQELNSLDKAKSDFDID